VKTGLKLKQHIICEVKKISQLAA